MREIAGFSLQWWKDFARKDNCLDRMVPSDLREILSNIPDTEPRAWIIRDKISGIERLIDGMKHNPRTLEFWVNAEVQKQFYITPLYKGKNLQ